MCRNQGILAEGLREMRKRVFRANFVAKGCKKGKGFLFIVGQIAHRKIPKSVIWVPELGKTKGFGTEPENS